MQVAVPEPPLELPHGFGAPPLRQDRQPRWVPRKATPPGQGELGVTHRAWVGECREDVPGSRGVTQSAGQELYAQRQLWPKLSLPDAFKPYTSDTKLNFSEPLPQKKGILNCGRWPPSAGQGRPLSPAPRGPALCRAVSCLQPSKACFADVGRVWAAERSWRCRVLPLPFLRFFSFFLSFWGCPTSTEEPKCALSL